MINYNARIWRSQFRPPADFRWEKTGKIFRGQPVWIGRIISRIFGPERVAIPSTYEWGGEIRETKGDKFLYLLHPDPRIVRWDHCLVIEENENSVHAEFAYDSNSQVIAYSKNEAEYLDFCGKIMVLWMENDGPKRYSQQYLTEYQKIVDSFTTPNIPV